MTVMCKALDKEYAKNDKALVITNKKMIQAIGHSKYFSRNEEFTHEKKFMNPSLWVCLNKHFTS